MKRIAAAGALAVCLVVLVGNVMATAGSGSQTIRSISHTPDFGVIDADGSGDAADSFADGFTALSEMRAEDDVTVIGSDVNTCSLADVVQQLWNCHGATTLGGGTIMYQGVFSLGARSVVAITGGTGDFKGARGWVVFKPLVGDDFPFLSVYHLIP
jgi:hypothetical protein